MSKMFSLNESTIKIFNNDLLNVIEDYKVSAEYFEEHSKKTKKIHDELKRPFLLIKKTQEMYPKMILNIGSGIIDLILDLYILDEEEEYIDYGF
jgi:hypothetical protein